MSQIHNKYQPEYKRLKIKPEVVNFGNKENHNSGGYYDNQPPGEDDEQSNQEVGYDDVSIEETTPIETNKNYFLMYNSQVVFVGSKNEVIDYLNEISKTKNINDFLLVKKVEIKSGIWIKDE